MEVVIARKIMRGSDLCFRVSMTDVSKKIAIVIKDPTKSEIIKGVILES